MIRKVIYVSYMRLSDKVSRDWYIDYLIEKGITVEFWDLVPLLRGEHGEMKEHDAKTVDYLHTFRTYGEIESRLLLPENRGAFYMMLINYDGQTVTIFRLLSKNNCRMLFLAWGVANAGRMQKSMEMLSKLFNPLWLAKKVYYKLKAVVYKKLMLVKPFDMVFASGQIMIGTKHHAVKVVSINAPDYDQYRKAGLENGRVVKGRYALFLDVYLPHHSDLKLIDGPSVNPDVYYASLNRFFNLLEMEHGIKVVIAAHPRADYRSNPFHGREIYYGRTPELAKDCDFVISHQSYSISYAVLNSKPALFIYTNEIVHRCALTIMVYIDNYATSLDAPLYNIDEITTGDMIVIRYVNKRCYEEYKYKYLTTKETEHVSGQEIFYREICNSWNSM